MIRAKLNELGIKEYMPSTTNQICIELDNAVAEKIHAEVICEDFVAFHTTKVIRFVTSFATLEEDVLKLNEILEKYLKK